MTVLVITTSYGDNAPGKVYKAFVDKLRREENMQVDVITTLNRTNETALLFKRRRIHHRLRKLSIQFFSIDQFDYSLAKQIIKKLDLAKYDCVYSLVSLHHFLPMYLGFLIKRKSPAMEWRMYSVDAIPPPEGWGISASYRTGLIKMINRFLPFTDHLYFSNKVMLKYQLDLLKHEFAGVSGYIHTASKYRDKLVFPENDDGNYNFVYTGGIYQARRPESLVAAFYRFSQEYTNSRLYFVGTNPESINLSEYPAAFKNKIIIVDYTDELENYYKLANVLIDIDADIDNDVFMSSKFFNYLQINRWLLCITRQDSPTYKFIKDHELQQVNAVGHCSEEIYNKMLSLYQKDIKKVGC